MSNAPNAQTICDATGISPSYAAKIIGGHRSPPASLAIVMYRKLGWRHQSLAGLTDEQISVLETVQPWVAPKERERAA